MRGVIVILLLLPLLSRGQSKYFVYLKDKPGAAALAPETYLSKRSLERRALQNIALREADFPVSSTYLTAIRNVGFRVIGKSKWLNAVLVEGDSTALPQLRALPGVTGIQGNGDIRGNTSLGQYARLRSKLDSPVTPIDYGSSAAQIKMLGADTMHSRGYSGKGVLIAVMDAGFPRVNTADAFAHLRNGNKILHTYNYVYETADVYRDNSHGTNVLSIIAGYLPGKLSGTAPGAEVALYVTEDALPDNESPLEEVYWALAAEHADSLGADVLNTSLGYYEFVDTGLSYTYSQMDGKTSIIARAADYATQTGMIVVNSAGNEGDSEWRYIATPADAEHVIAVGAVNASRQKSTFSSFGPTADGRIKPEVCAMGQGTVLSNNGSAVSTGNGTSYSGPLIAGFMAGLKQQFPQLTALQLREILIRSADRYPSPDNAYGYGVPSYTRAVNIVYGEYLPLEKEPTALEMLTYPNPWSDGRNLSVSIGGKSLADFQKVRITDSGGRVLYEAVELGRFRPAQLENGLYFLSIPYEGKVYTAKLLINR